MSSFSRSFHAAPLPNEVQRLQSEVENFTHRLEQQRRRNVAIDEELPKLSRSVQLRMDHFKTKLPSINQTKKEQNKIRLLQNQIDKEKKYLSQLESKNQGLIGEINQERKEKVRLLQNIQNLQKKIVFTASKAEKAQKKFEDYKTLEDKQMQSMLDMKQKAEADLNFLSSNIQCKQQSVLSDQANQSIALKQIDKTFSVQNMSKQSQDNVDPTSSLQKLYDNWLKQCTERHQQIESYQKGIKILKDAYGQIKRATGTNDIDELVVSFVKSEEQNHKLKSYLNALSTDYEVIQSQYNDLQQQYNNIKSQCEDNHQSQIQSMSKKHQIMNQSKDKVDQYKANIANYENNLKQSEKVVEDILQHFGYDLNQEIEASFEKNLGKIEIYLAQLIQAEAQMKGSDAPESFIMDFPNEFNTTHDISNCLKTIDQLGLIEDDIEEMNVMNRQELLDKSMRIYSDTYAK